MKTLAIYALEVLACSGVLLAAYAILLDRRVRFGWCRAYLLASTLLAAVIPLLRIPVWPGEVVEVAPTVALPATEWTAEVVEEAAPAVTPETVCLTVYLIGVGLVAGVMLWQVVRIRRLRRGAAITAQSVSRSCAPRSGSRRSRSSVRSTSGTRSRPASCRPSWPTRRATSPTATPPSAWRWSA